MNLITNTRVSKLKHSLEKSGLDVWKKVEFLVEEDFLFISLHLVSFSDDNIKKILRYFREHIIK